MMGCSTSSEPMTNTAGSIDSNKFAILGATKKTNQMIENNETRNEQNKPENKPSSGGVLIPLITLGIVCFILYTIITM